MKKKNPPKDMPVKEVFRAVQEYVIPRFPSLKAEFRFCRKAAAEHRKSWRQFAHAGHHPSTICFARAADTDLTLGEKLGIMLHEFGHLMAFHLHLPGHELGDYELGEQEANEMVRHLLKLPIRYNERSLEETPPGSFF